MTMEDELTILQNALFHAKTILDIICDIGGLEFLPAGEDERNAHRQCSVLLAILEEKLEAAERDSRRARGDATASA